MDVTVSSSVCRWTVCDKIWDANDQVRSFSFSRIKTLNFTEIEVGSAHFVETRNFIFINKHVNYKTHLTVRQYLCGKFEFAKFPFGIGKQKFYYSPSAWSKNRRQMATGEPPIHTLHSFPIFRVISAWSYFIFIEIEFQMNKLVCQGVRVNC